jgi:hypothetical protein
MRGVGQQDPEIKKMSSLPAPRPKANRTFPWIYKIEQDFVYRDTGWILQQEYVSEWLHISQQGVITVKANQKGYAWDGCTPKKSVFNLFIIGIPDGHVDYRTMQPYTYYASLVHDALYQYLESVPVSKAQIDQLFLKMLKDFKLRRLYYLAVKNFGGRGVVQKGLVPAAKEKR